MITVAAITMKCVGNRCYPDTWQEWVVICAIVVVVVVVHEWVSNTPQARCRRTLKLLHRLGGATLVWDASEGGFFTLPYQSEDGEWYDLAIRGHVRQGPYLGER